METNFLCEAEKFPHGEYAALADEIIIWQDKYSRWVIFLLKVSRSCYEYVDTSIFYNISDSNYSGPPKLFRDYNSVNCCSY